MLSSTAFPEIHNLGGFCFKSFFFSINVGNCIHVKTKNSSYNEMIFHKEDF